MLKCFDFAIFYCLQIMLESETIFTCMCGSIGVRMVHNIIGRYNIKNIKSIAQIWNSIKRAPNLTLYDIPTNTLASLFALICYTILTSPVR